MRNGLVTAIGFVLLAGLASAPFGQEKPADYFPLRIGTKWEYQCGERKYSVRVSKHEKLGNASCAVLETGSGDGVLTELVSIEPDGVYRHAVNGQKLEPPLRILKLPPRAGDTWKFDIKHLGKSSKGTFTLAEAEIEVPAGKFRAVSAEGRVQVNDHKFTVVYWFAPGVGLVRQATRIDGKEEAAELVKFTPGK